jgi:large subunit ribosomal protein L4
MATKTGTPATSDEATLTVPVRGSNGASTGTVDLPADLFGVQTNIPLIHQVVVAQLAAARQGTHSTKTRGMVSGGGKKPYKQKGTGRARQGSTRAPQFTGGGVVHGPQPRDYSQRTPKKMKAAALRGALSDRARLGRVHVLDELVPGDTPSTKAAAAALSGLTTRPKLLLVVSRTEVSAAKSIRNLKDLHVLWPDQLNTYDVLCSDDVVFTRTALDEFVSRSSRPTGRTTDGAADASAPTTAAIEEGDE